MRAATAGAKNKSKSANNMIHRFILILAAMLLAANAAGADFPKTPAGKAAEEFLAMIQKGTEAEREQFIKTHYSKAFLNRAEMAKHLRILGDLKRDLAAGKLKEAKATDKGLTLVYELPSETLMLDLRLSDGQPPKIAGLKVELTN